METRSADGLDTVLSTTGGSWSQAAIALTLKSASRPFVLINERELSVLRRGLTKPGWKRTLYLEDSQGVFTAVSGAGILAAANSWLERETNIPERAGNLQDLYCEDGTELECSTGDGKNFSCPACGRTYRGEMYEAAYRGVQHLQLASAALSCAVVYGIEKDREYAEKTVELLLGYARAYSVESSATGTFPQSADGAKWIMPLAQAYDLIYQSKAMTDSDRREIEHSLFRPAASRLMDAGIDGSQGSWHLSAVGVIGFATKNAALVEYGLNCFIQQMTEQLGSDGLWPESVHHNHFRVLSAYVQLAEAAHRAGINLYNWQESPKRSLRNMFLEPIRYMYPDFRLPAINNGHCNSYLPLDLYEIAARRFDDTELAWVLKAGYRLAERPMNPLHKAERQKLERRSFYSFLFGRDMPGRLGEPVIGSHDFDSIGTCVLRAENEPVATLQYGPRSEHGQRDKMSITLYGASDLLIPDYGDPGCRGGIMRWYNGTASHNTVVVDEKDQQPTDENELLEYRPGSLLQLAKAATRQAYPGVCHTRQLLLTRSALFIVDDLSGSETHTYDWILRAEGKLRLEGDVNLQGVSVEYAAMENVKMGEVGDWTASWEGQNSVLRLWMWQPDGSKLYTGSVPAETAIRRAAFVMSRQKGSRVRFLSCLLPHAKDAEVSCERRGRLFKVTCGDIEEWLYIDDAGDDVEEHSVLTTDARMAYLVRRNDEDILACSMIGGQNLLWRDQTIIQTGAPVDQIDVRFDARNPTITYSGSVDGTIKLRSNARAMRLNGQRVSASGSDGMALLRIQRRWTPADDERREQGY